MKHASNDEPSGKEILRLAQEEARRLGHNFVGTEQLLLALLLYGPGIPAKIVIGDFGVEIDKAREQVEAIIGSGAGFVATEIPLTPRAKRVLELSWDEARQLGQNFVGPEHLLLGLLREGECGGVRVLENLGVDKRLLRALILSKINGGDCHTWSG